MDLDLKDLVRTQIKQAITEIVRETVTQVVNEELRAAVGGSASSSPAPAKDPVRLNNVRLFKYSKRSVIRVNPRFVGNPASPGTATLKIYETARDLLGTDCKKRSVLTKEIETLLPQLKPHQASSCISTLLDRGALVVVPGEPHAIGEAYRP